MASWTCLLFLTLFRITSGFDCTLECNKHSHGWLGQQSLLECIVKGTVPIERVTEIRWSYGTTRLIIYQDGKLTSKQGFTLAEPSWNETNMNVSMLLNKTMKADIGNYTCIVNTNRGICRNSTTLDLSAIDSSPTIGVTESLQKFSTLSCNDGGCDPDRRIDPHPESQLAYKVVPPVVVVLLIIGLLFFLKRQCNKRTHEVIPTDNQDLCNGEHQPHQV
ncbi:jupiter microtubule associated homolog 1a isoform X2 [Gadus chalcogrammus]|uniref:jupiter microtubule associated homolog 1a isoform X2 n=1 Tax=Gadus chalcogrammus TaxID=1042646 RepID=UPI0024C3A5CC|nr:jupiter microtubule associated homolog 1a isoform X2 [Gadus chalcogrammus]